MIARILMLMLAFTWMLTSHEQLGRVLGVDARSTSEREVDRWAHPRRIGSVSVLQVPSSTRVRVRVADGDPPAIIAPSERAALLPARSLRVVRGQETWEVRP